jgi:hypothetical protein
MINHHENKKKRRELPGAQMNSKVIYADECYEIKRRAGVF